MNTLDNYKDLPDGLSPDEVNRLTRICLSESAYEEDAITLEKLWHLGLLQYHTYQLPPDDIRDKLSLWMAENGPLWSGREIVRALAVTGMYGLDKGLYSNLLERCPIDRKWQFDKKLAKSKGNLIDPYYDLRKDE
jgi:hypothetical protein